MNPFTLALVRMACRLGLHKFAVYASENHPLPRRPRGRYIGHHHESRVCLHCGLLQRRVGSSYRTAGGLVISWEPWLPFNRKESA